MPNTETIHATCPECGCVVPYSETELVYARGETQRWCKECIAVYTIQCDRCQANILTNSDYTEHPEYEHLCMRCYNSLVRIPEQERIDNKIGYFSMKFESGKVMQLCNYHEYERLIHPEKLWRTRIAKDDGTPDLEFNNRNPNSQSIKNLDSPLLGIELEMSGAGLNAYYAYLISCEMGFPTTNSSELKFSRDGSLPRGLEVISMPGNLNYHTKVLNWEQGMKKAVSLGYRSHDSGICGLHVHVNRSFFNEDNDLTEDKFTTFVYNNSEWLKKFSRRTNFDYCRFIHKSGYQNNTIAFANYTEDIGNWTKTKEYFRALDLTKNFNHDHHAAISFSPSKTIEFRLFRGTLVYTTFIASLQLVIVICKLIKENDIQKVQQLRLRHIISAAKKLHYKELIDYINSRKCKEFGHHVFETSVEDYAMTEQDVNKHEHAEADESCPVF